MFFRTLSAICRRLYKFLPLNWSRWTGVQRGWRNRNWHWARRLTPNRDGPSLTVGKRQQNGVLPYWGAKRTEANKSRNWETITQRQERCEEGAQITFIGWVAQSILTRFCPFYHPICSHHPFVCFPIPGIDAAFSIKLMSLARCTLF